MSKENEVKTEEKAMKEKELEKSPEKGTDDGELDTAEMKDVTGGDIWSFLGIKKTGGHRRRN